MTLASRSGSGGPPPGLRLPRLARTQWALRGVVFGAALLALAATLLSGAAVPAALIPALVLILAPAAWVVESWASGLVAVGLVVLYAIASEDPLSPAAVLAASAVLAVHLGGALAESGPRQAELPSGLIRRYLVHWAAGTAAAALLWGVARLAVGLTGTTDSQVALSLLALAALAVLAVLALRLIGPRRTR